MCSARSHMVTQAVPSLQSLGLPPTTAALLRRAVGRAPDAIALIDGRRAMTYGEFDAEVTAAARALTSLGVRSGDRVAASLGNRAEIVVLFFAVMRIGAVWVGVNKALAPPEKEFILRDAGVKTAFVDASLMSKFGALKSGPGGLETVVGIDSEVGIEWWDKFASDNGEPEFDTTYQDRDPFQPALIAYTSGTTGHPKGAVHSEHNLILPGASLSRGEEFGCGTRIGVCLPLTIANMIIMGPLITFQTEACCVLIDSMRPRDIAAAVADRSIESMTLVPTTLFDLVQDTEIRPESLRSLSKIQTGGASWSADLIERFTAKFGTRPVGTYGLTEVPTCVALEPRHLPVGRGASGRPNTHLRVVICDGTGHEVPPGEVGEICIGAALRGPWEGVYRLMLNYWNRTSETSAALQHGLLHTGDVGSVDDAGDLYVHGRLTEVIHRGGANVAPAEVEVVLSEHAAVRGSAVIGVPDERLGEIVVAVIELAASVSDEELYEHCAARLAHYKRPVKFVRVSSLPRNSMGKVLKNEVRRLAVMGQGRPSRVSG
jgi:long-chain acyl-CoA synthetase